MQERASIKPTRRMSGHSNRIIYKVNWLNLKADLLQKRSIVNPAPRADGEINSGVCVLRAKRWIISPQSHAS
jgi:hypothetical protein